jgi:S-adenosyl methyltransferase
VPVSEAEYGPDGQREGIAGLDTTVAHPARVYDYWLGGSDNFAADREAAERVLAAEAGIRQFLDIGTGIPAAGNTHEVAQRAASDSRVVYVDNDPIVLRHAQALLRGTPAGRDRLPAGRPARSRGDLGPGGRRTRFRAAGGGHAARGAAPDPGRQANAQRVYNERVATPQTLRTREQAAWFFTGLDLIEPGLVQVHQWRPGPADTAPDEAVSAHGAVARKPSA